MKEHNQQNNSSYHFLNISIPFQQEIFLEN